VDLEFVANIVAIAVSLGVGIPILKKSWREQNRPGVLLSLAVISDGLEWLFWALCVYTPAWGTPLGDAFSVLCRIGITASAFFFLAFTREVFRPNSRVAMALAWVLGIGMVVGFVGSGLVGDWPGLRNDNIWIWIENVTQMAVYLWSFGECMVYYAKMRRRIQHGLASPVVTNRILLWGFYSAGFTVSIILYEVVLAFFADITALDAFIAGATVAGEVALWLAFFPPARYLAWVRGGATAH
jgi:hypothetical protein